MTSKYNIGQLISGCGGNAIMGEIVAITITAHGITYRVRANNSDEYILQENALLLVFDVDKTMKELNK